MDEFSRTPVRRSILIVDQECRIVARDSFSDPVFAPYAGERLPERVEAAARASTGSHILSPDCVLHVAPMTGNGHRLRALVFEELRVRAEP